MRALFMFAFEFKPNTSSLNMQDIKPEDLVISDFLGAGAFGDVHKAVWQNNDDCIQVAVKTMDSDRTSRMEVLEEGLLMVKLTHKHIVKCYGICVYSHCSTALVMELMRLGALDRYLRSSAHQLFDVFFLTDICVDVAEGLAYLTANNFIHRDLAARNVLLTQVNGDIQAKISDFGLTKYSDIDHIDNVTSVPYAWNAPEVNQVGSYSSASDIWSFGVVVWEVFSLGDLPFGTHRNEQIGKLLKDGQRLEQPEDCPDDVYSLMKRCWEYKPANRPNIDDVLQTIKVIANSLESCSMDGEELVI